MPEVIAVEVTRPNASALRAPAQGWLDKAELMIVDDQSSYTATIEEIKEIKREYKDLEAKRRKLKQPIDQAAKEVQSLFKAPLEFLSKAESILKSKCNMYLLEEEKKRREAQARAEELARKEREKLEARAEKARAKGKEEYADALEAQADSTPVIAPPPPPVAAGASTRKQLEGIVTDKMALVRAVCEGKVPENAVTVDTVLLNKMVRALGKDLSWPGVEVREKMGLSIRT